MFLQMGFVIEANIRRKKQGVYYPYKYINNVISLDHILSNQ
jgi:hypothetical protein